MKGKMALFPSKVFYQYKYFKALIHDKRMQISTRQCPQLVSLSLGEILRLSSRNFLWRLSLAAGEMNARSLTWCWLIFEDVLVIMLIFPFPPTSGWELTFSKHVTKFCKRRLLYWVILKATAASHPWAQESAGPSNLGRKAVRLDLWPKSPMTRTSCYFIGSSHIFLKQLCILSSNPYFYCWVYLYTF